MKKIVSLVLAMSMVLSMFVSAFAATTSTFDDVKDTKYASAVDALVELNVIDGLPDGTYGPEKEVTRAQLAKMLVICLGLGDTVESLEGRTVFTDVADSHWASGYINAAVQSKVIAGYPDGTFKPEKNVTYAEAVTMVIRALGYGNVVEAEGTWPTAYMLKAVELELLDNMDSPKAGDAASRGNTAILLWNMLRTAMWKINSENETNGMNSAAGSIMLNVKFPDYYYFEDAYVDAVTVTDRDVEITLVDEDGDILQTAYVEDVDLPRVLEGMKVSALVKDYKDKEDATFLTMTPAYSFVEGVVTKVLEDSNRIEIDDVEYRVNDASAYEQYEYVVLEVEGKKATTYSNGDVCAILPKDGKIVEKITSMERDIDEDALVIIDGEWATRTDIEVGDVYTAMDDGAYYMVSRERVEGTFESLTYTANTQKESYVVEVDGEEYVAFDGILEAYEGTENDEDVTLDEEGLMQVAKDNKYIDNEVEVVFNYLGQAIVLYFGDVAEKANDGDFYAVTSAGSWSEGSSSGKIWYITLAGLDGEEETYTFKSSASKVASEFETDEYGVDGEPLFVWVKFKGDEIEEMVSINELGDGVVSDTKYSVAAITDAINDDGYLNDPTEEANGHKATVSTSVLTVTPIEEDEVVEGFEVEASTGTAALDGVENGYIIYETESATKRAKFVLVSEDAKSSEKHFGILSDATNKGGKVYAVIDGERYEMYDDDMTVSAVKAYADQVVIYTVTDGKVDIEQAIDVDVLLEANVITKVEDEFVFVDGDESTVWMDVTLEANVKAYEKYPVALVSASTDKDNVVLFDEVEYLGEGLGSATFRKGCRVFINDTEGYEYIILIEGFAYDDVIVDGGDKGVVLDPTATPAWEDEDTKTVVEKVTESALAYEYDDGYEYSSTITVSGDTVTISATDFDADKDGVSVFSADTARFLGGLYRSEEIETITYKGTAYTWDTKGTLKGSNYKSEDGTTLVSVLRTAQKGGTVSFDLELDNEETLVYAVENVAD